MDLSHYRVIRIPKKGGFRTIHIPSDELKEKQREYLANEIRRRPKFSRRLCAFVRGRSIVDAARPHVGKKYLVHLDIKDFFHHVTRKHVLSALIFDRLLYREIETRNSSLLDLDWKRVGPPYGLLDLAFIPSPVEPGEMCLPQGSPLSPYLSLLASKAVDFKIERMIRNQKLDVAHTMYADGIYLSSDNPRVIPMARHGVEKILRSEGFISNRSKFRVMRRSGSQRVCGLSVNRKVTVPKRKRREIRGRLHAVFKDIVHDRSVNLKEWKYLEGYLSFAAHADPSFLEKCRKKLDFVRSALREKGLV